MTRDERLEAEALSQHLDALLLTGTVPTVSLDAGLRAFSSLLIATDSTPPVAASTRERLRMRAEELAITAGPDVRRPDRRWLPELDWLLRWRWTQRRPRLITRVAVALVVAAILALAGLPWLSRSEPTASAAELLNRLADVAVAQPANPAPGAGYAYQRKEAMWRSMMARVQVDGAPLTALVPVTREDWIAPDGSGRIREIVGEPVWPSEKSRAAWQAAGSPTVRPGMNRDFGPGGLSTEDFTRLPTEPDALAEIVRRRAAQADPPLDIEMFIVVGDLLRRPGAPPELRSALYKVAAKIPEVELVGDVTDRLGRAGVAIAKDTGYWGGKQRFVLIFDPKTSALLEEQTVLLEPVEWLDARPPVVIGYTTYLDSGIVPSLPGEPLPVLPEATPRIREVP